ncbi:MAG: hypothetical protein J2P15_06385 [Micromonosporaceae bacterium]|nr:hypothetical protein [Micromonosporaceae bacterium]
MMDAPVLETPAPRPGPYALARLNRPPRRRPPGYLYVFGAYLAISLVIFGHLLRHLNDANLQVGPADQDAFDWFLWYGAHALGSGANPLYTTLFGPGGANLMANTSVLGIGVPLLPLTLLAGPQVALALALVLGLAGSAAAWYWLFRRLVPRSRLAAGFAGGFCGFSPAAVSHANGAHLNLLVTFLVPFIIANALRLAEPKRLLRNAVPLGLLVAYQAFIGEELILLTAVGLALFCLCYLLLQPRAALRAARVTQCGTTSRKLPQSPR